MRKFNTMPLEAEYSEHDDRCDLDNLLHPAQAFEHPSHVVKDPDLTLNEKRAILGLRSALCWNSMWRNLQRHEVIVLGGEVNWLIDDPCCERLPTIDLAHVDLTGGEQRPEQHGGGLC
jgi:hypothetical protein